MTLEGTVEARNDRGIKVNGEWTTVSKYRPVALPDVGTRVRAEVDPKGFLTSIDVLDAGASSSTREQTIARLTVLKAAARFAADRQDIKSADVLRIAELWLAWVDTDG